MMLLEDWLDDLCVRFIINIPREELVELERICFQIEEAQWFYEDFIRPLDPKLPSLGLKPFFQRIISRCPVFKDRPHEDWASAYDRFILYKNRVPVRGAILLNDQMDHVLLVKGWKKTATWSFPRGKINKDELDIDCAIREAWEETGFDIKLAGLVPDSRKVRHVEKTLRDQSVKLFIFRGVPLDYPFVPQTRKEISKCEWYRIADLPTNHKAKHVHQEGSGQHLIVNANKFYMVAPFVQELKKIITQLKKGDHRHSSKLAAPPTTMEAVHILSTADAPMVMPSEAPTLKSPAIPSSLPEVTPVSAQDHSLRLKQQLDMPPPAHVGMNNPVMSNALLSMLRGAPLAEMRNDPHTPLEQPDFRLQPKSPERPVPPTISSMQSPPPTSEMQQVPQSAATLSPLTQQLNQHTRSLLDTFSQAKVQNPAIEARQQLPFSKQDLLAAFTAKPKPSPILQAESARSTNHGNSLLQMLQRSPNIAEAATQTVAPEDPLARSVQEAPAPSNPPRIPQPTTNPLLNLLKSTGPTISMPVSAEVPATSLAETFKQIELAELSAASDHDMKPTSADAVKANILSMLGTMPPKTARTADKEKSRKGSTAASLSGPIVQPQFDAIVAPVSEDDLKRPTTGQRKLFDPRNDEFRPPPIKVISRHEHRDRQKSPRVPRQQKANHTGRPVTPKEPKEAPKPFQPQILKRPQASESEPSLSHTLANATLPADGLARTMTTQSPDLNFVTAAASREQSTVAEDNELNHILPAPVPVAAPTSKPVIPQDPQREALLSLLRTPIQAQAQAKSQKAAPMTIDLDDTPRSVAIPITSTESSISQLITTAVPSPPASVFPSQIVSPINDMEPLASRSRVSSLASIGTGLTLGGSKDGNMGTNKPQAEKRQTAAGDKAFLMNYLRGFANQGHEAS